MKQPSFYDFLRQFMPPEAGGDRPNLSPDERNRILANPMNNLLDQMNTATEAGEGESDPCFTDIVGDVVSQTARIMAGHADDHCDAAIGDKISELRGREALRFRAGLNRFNETGVVDASTPKDLADILDQRAKDCCDGSELLVLFAIITLLVTENAQNATLRAEAAKRKTFYEPLHDIGRVLLADHFPTLSWPVPDPGAEKAAVTSSPAPVPQGESSVAPPDKYEFDSHGNIAPSPAPVPQSGASVTLTNVQDVQEAGTSAVALDPANS